MISVIIPVYNVSKYLRRCVDSIIHQTYQDIEILLIDDGSTDGSSEICDEYALRDSRVYVIHKENGGLSDARNCGIDAAAGEYLCFIDSDDFIADRMIEHLYMLLKRENADMSVCDFFWINEDEINDAEDALFDKENVEVFTGHAIQEQLFNNNIVTVVAWNKLYRRDIFETLRYPVGSVHEDEYVIHHILSKCRKTVYTNAKLYYYMKHGNTITANKNAKNVYDIVTAYEERINFYEMNKDLSMYQKSIPQCLNYIKVQVDCSNVLDEHDKKILIDIVISYLGKAVRTRSIRIRRAVKLFVWGMSNGCVLKDKMVL